MDNKIVVPSNRVLLRTPCWDAVGRRGRRQRRWKPLPSSLAVDSLPGYCRLAAAQTMPLVEIVTKFGGGIPADMPRVSSSADNAIGGPCHQVWRQTPCWDALVQQRCRQHCRWPLPPSLASGSLLGCCWPAAAQAMPSAALIMKFGGGIPVGILLAGGGTDSVVVRPCHQVWWRNSC